MAQTNQWAYTVAPPALATCGTSSLLFSMPSLYKNKVGTKNSLCSHFRIMFFKLLVASKNNMESGCLPVLPLCLCAQIYISVSYLMFGVMVFSINIGFWRLWRGGVTMLKSGKYNVCYNWMQLSLSFHSNLNKNSFKIHFIYAEYIHLKIQKM